MKRYISIITIVMCLFFSTKNAIAQCDIKFMKQKGDTIFLSSSNIPYQIRCTATVYLIYSTKDDPNRYRWSQLGVKTENIELRRKSNNKLLATINRYDTIYPCFWDTINKYVQVYFKNPKRMLTEKEIQAASQEQKNYPPQDIKIELILSSIYIYPSKTKIKRPRLQQTRYY